MNPRTLLCCALLALSCAVSADDQDEYDACVLQYQKGAKTDFSAYLIGSACRKLHQDGGVLLSREKAYNECLLQNLPGVESDLAARQIQSTCQRQHLEW